MTTETFVFSGTVFSVDPNLGSVFATGQSISGSYTFDSAAPDTDGNEPSAERRAAGKWLWEAAFGRPVQPIAESSEGRVIHEYRVRWLPPDPNDHSKVIEPEPDC
jgi:hypothetical protein